MPKNRRSNHQPHYATALVQLPLIRESGPDRCKTPEDIARFCDDLRGLAQESFHVVTLNIKNYIISRYMITLGLADASLVHPREVFRPAIQDGATAIIMVHNHPSGDPTPSAEDIRVTKQLIEAGRILDLKVLDHIIIGRPDRNGALDRGLISLREEGLCNFC